MKTSSFGLLNFLKNSEARSFRNLILIISCLFAFQFALRLTFDTRFDKGHLVPTLVIMNFVHESMHQHDTAS